MRSLQGGERRLTKLGKGFFRDKYYEYLVHVPVIIRGRRRSGRNAGAGYERRDWLPVNELGGATRHPAHLTEEQVAQRVRQQVEASLDPGGPILQLSDETYFLDPEGHWVVSTQSTRYRNSRTEVETLLRQRMRTLTSVSFQLPCEEDVLPSAFEDKPLCVPRQLAELLQLSVEEVCADFDAMLRHDWRRLGISAEEVREFCVWRNAPMRVLSSQGDLVDSYDPALKEHRTVCFLAFDGHCYMYRAVKRVLERQAARVLYRGEARQTLPPIQEWRRFDAADVQPGLFWCEDLREARRQLMAAGESPKVAISSPAQYCGLRLRRGTRIRELPEEHEVLRRWCEALNQEYRGQRLAGLAHEIFLKLLKAKREVPGAAERQKTLAAQDGKCALCGCGLTGACELDHVVPVRQAFAGSVQTLQALCGDCHSEKTLRESAQPTSLESRVAPGVMEYVRSPKLPPLVFEAQTCAKDSTYVGVDVVRCRRNGLANAPFPLPILCPADGGRRAAGPGLCGGLLRREAVLPEPVAVRGARLVPEGFAGRDAGAGRLPLGPHRVGHLRAEPRGRGDAAARAGAHGRRVARRGAHGQAQRERDDRPVGAQHGGGLQRAQQQQRAGRRGRGLLSGLRLRGGHGVGLRLRAEAAEQRHLPPHPRRGAGL